MWSMSRFNALWLMWKFRLLDHWYREAELNKKAPNPKVLNTNGGFEMNLLDFASSGHPLVLNFGSCT